MLAIVGDAWPDTPPWPGCYNDLYMYEPDLARWTNLTDTVAGPAPVVRAYLGFAACGGKLYVFGGYSDVAGPSRLACPALPCAGGFGLASSE